MSWPTAPAAACRCERGTALSNTSLRFSAFRIGIALCSCRERGGAAGDVGIAVDPEELEGLSDAERQQLLQVWFVELWNRNATAAVTPPKSPAWGHANWPSWSEAGVAQ